ncbi:MAG: NADH-quinone oxidoreductase subunit M [Gemmatimonadota bacterium]|nr:NADH-quinone oxidoreductase subunit M [Gemmatimonadota bacterium]
MDFPWLTTILFFPLAGAALIAGIPGSKKEAIRQSTLAVTVLHFLIALPLWWLYDPAGAEFQFVERVPWVEAFGIEYHLGVDGVSALLALLTVFLMPLAVLGSWRYIEDHVKEFHVFMLVLTTGMLGVFFALDLFVFYVFWELMLVPMYFLIGIWGGTERIYAAVKFFLYTFVGGLLMLVGILALYFYHEQVTGTYSTALADLIALDVPGSLQTWMFLAFALAFAIKVPMFPFHTWLPDAHVQAPSAGSVILAGVLLKMGTYGFYRFAMPLFPDATATFLPILAVLAVVGIVYGAMVALVQPNVKKLVAYSSVSHLGFVMLGLFALTTTGVQGSVIQMINHGISTGALFFICGMLYERRHTYEIERFGGLSASMPAFATVFMIVTLSSIGLPGLNGFVGEFLILVGTFGSHPYLAGIATVGVILAAYYMLRMYGRVMFGPVDDEENADLPDLSPREWAVLAPLVALIFWIGVYPSPFLERTEPSVERFVERFEGASRTEDLGASVRVVPEPESGDAGIVAADDEPGGTRR